MGVCKKSNPTQTVRRRSSALTGGWRKRGWLKTVNIAGRQYLTQVAIDEFRRRAVAGDFAQVYKVPAPGGRGVSTRIYTLRGNPQRNVSQGGGVLTSCDSLGDERSEANRTN